MERRTLLSALSAIPIGCISMEREKTDTSEYMGQTFPKVSIEGTSIEPDKDLEFNLSIAQQFEDASPAMIDVELTNGGNVTRSFQTGPSLPLNPVRGYHQRSGDESLFLVPSDGTGYEAPESITLDEVDSNPPESSEQFIPPQSVDGCWQAQRIPLSVYSMARGETLETGESIQRRYTLVAHPDNDPCLPPGAYTFTDDAQIDDQEVAIDFTLDVARET